MIHMQATHEYEEQLGVQKMVITARSRKVYFQALGAPSSGETPLRRESTIFPPTLTSNGYSGPDFTMSQNLEQKA